MSLPELCIRRPVMTTLLMLAFVIFGLFSYRLLPVAAIPKVDFPTIVVTGHFPGASPETMAASVATPLERQFSTIAGLNSMVSSSGLGVTQITMQFDLSRDIDGAALDVQSALTSAARKLPIQMTTPPSFLKANPADAPVIFLNLNSSTMPLSDVDEYAETLIAQRLSTLSGVSQVLVMGQQKFAVRVQANPEALAAKGMTLDDLQNAVAAANSSTPVGTLMGQNQAYTIQANGQLPHASQYQNLIVAYRNGAPVRLKDVAKAVDSVEDDRQASWYNGNLGILLAVQRQPDANTVEVVDSVKALIPFFESQLPASVKLNVLLDHSVSIRNSVSDVQTTLLITAALVVLVIFIFLRNVTATLIPALALPVSVIGTFAGMEMLGYSIDNLSLMALTLSVGFVVDDAIVMLENIMRHVEGGERVIDAAFRGSREIAFTILSITLSLVAVFIPVLFMGGVVGRVFREFAVTISLTILISGFVSLTLTPMLASRLIKAHHGEHHNLAYRAFERGFDALLAGYKAGLGFVLRWRFVTLLLTVCSIALSGYLFAVVPKGFFPVVDTGVLIGSIEAAQDISMKSMSEHTMEVARVIKADPNVSDVTAFVGAGGQNPALNQGRFFIQLKPRDQRELSATQVIQELRPKVARVAGTNTFFQPLQDINLGGRPSKSQFQYTLQDGNTDELYKFAGTMESRMRGLTGVQDVTSDLQLRNRLAMIDINRDKAAQMGITIDQVKNTFYSAFGTRQISTIYQPSNSYEVIIELDPADQQAPTDLSKIYVRASSGQMVPLAALATISEGIGPVTINHQGQLPSVTVSFNLQPGFSLGTAIDEIKQLEHDVDLPVSVSSSYQGNAQVFQQALQGQGLLLSAAVIVIYIVLGILYESFIHPITILSGLPAAALGALLTLMLFHQDMSVIAIIGVVMLIGIVKKNAIMMIDFALDRQRNGASAEEAIFDACLLRFRPIMMTTMAAIMGGLPIAVGWGEGAELRRPLGLVVVGGLVVSQSLTLFITPVIFLYLEKFRLLFARGGETVPALGAPDGHPVREAGE
ncbi:MAG TPA: efflux RND transporter permease subunit [Stellaceae bacterium]|jgi:HAE1 family hydrophobic/amphiphilic exporter-1|nr:efflux RND transporter permease subunit [Stellaceae bacterium]